MPSIEPTDWSRDSAGRKTPARGTRWKARYRDPTGRSRARTFPTKAAARQFLEDLGSETRRDGFADPRLGRRKFEEWAEDWFETKAHRKPGTVRVYRATLNQYVLPAFRGYRIETIDELVVQKWLVSLSARGLSPKTVRNLHSVLVGVLDVAVRQRALRKNPARGQELPKRVRRRAPMFLEPAEAKAFVASLPKPYDLAAETMLLTGMRPAEMCGIRVGDIDFPRRRVIVSETVGIVSGRVVVGPTKTDKVRSIPLPASLVEKLSAHLAERARAVGREMGRQDRVFVARRGGPLRTSWFADQVRAAARTIDRAGLRAYDLRHTYAAMLIANGAHPKTVQERMGHESIAITMDIYGHLFDGLEEQATSALDEMWRAAEPEAHNVVPFGRLAEPSSQDTRSAQNSVEDTRSAHFPGRSRSPEVDGGHRKSAGQKG